MSPYVSKMDRRTLSVVVPCCNEQDNIVPFYEEFLHELPALAQRDMDYELIYVDDGSTDETVARVIKLHERDERVKLLSFSRNFGKEAAMYAGFEHAHGDLVAVMDADLQDPPSLLPQMLGLIDEGNDSVALRRVSRKGEPPVRSLFAGIFYRLLNAGGHVDVRDGARDYRLMTRRFIDAVLALSERCRFTKGIFGWVGYRTAWLEYENVARAHGETKWNFWKLSKYAINGLAGFTDFPLMIPPVLGAVFICAALGLSIAALVLHSAPLALGAAIFLTGGAVLCGQGVLGLYIARTHTEVRHRPMYLISLAIPE